MTPDGNLWFNENAGNQIGRMTPDGAITEFPIPTPNSSAVGIVYAADGNLWFTEYSGRIGRITLAGTITEFPVPTPASAPAWLAVGPDGNLWFNENDANKVATSFTVTCPDRDGDQDGDRPVHSRRRSSPTRSS